MRYAIAMVSDFFYPKLGGVESHILNLSKELKRLGHKVIVITKATKKLSGIRYTEEIKTYYLNLFSAFGNSVFPTFLCTAGALGKIFLEEKIDIVHGHQCSTLALEGVLYGKMLGLSVCFTNHSLVKINTIGGVVTATAMQMGLTDADKIICVSQASRNNTAERLGIDRHSIEVVPNAAAEGFSPRKVESNKKETIIVVVSRLTLRKGAALLAEILPDICELDPSIKIVIAGDGDKKELLEQKVDLHGLKERVILLGGVHPQQVKEILNHSNMFLNTSLTDAFCISIIEAASCGLYTVSTNVDGIAEILPEDMITLTPATPEGILRGIKEALHKIPNYKKEVSHKRVRYLYTWSSTAEKILCIYKKIHRKEKTLSATDRLNRSSREAYAKRKEFCISFLVLFFLSYLFLLYTVKKNECRAK